MKKDRIKTSYRKFHCLNNNTDTQKKINLIVEASQWNYLWQGQHCYISNFAGANYTLIWLKITKTHARFVKNIVIIIFLIVEMAVLLIEIKIFPKNSGYFWQSGQKLRNESNNIYSSLSLKHTPRY